MFIVLILDVPFGSDKVKVAVYVPLGKVTGKGVRKVEFVKLNAVPVIVVNVQLTAVVDDMLLPVDIKVKSTLDPAQTFNWLLLLYKGFVIDGVLRFIGVIYNLLSLLLK